MRLHLGPRQPPVRSHVVDAFELVGDDELDGPGDVTLLHELQLRIEARDRRGQGQTSTPARAVSRGRRPARWRSAAPPL